MSDKEQFSSSGTGHVLAAGTLPKIDLAGATELTVTIQKVSSEDGMNMVKAEYPDGFVKNHQADTVEELLGKVTNQLKGRYGVSTFEIETIPAALKADETIQLKEVVYGS